MTFLSVSQQKAKNEELIQLAEQRKKEVERKKTEAEEKERAALRRQYERERQARVDEVGSTLFSTALCKTALPKCFTVYNKHA